MNSRRQLLASLALAIAIAPASADEIPTIAIRLSSFAFTPDQIRLRRGAPVRLQLVNESSGGHNFSAPEFFAASTFPAGTAPPDGKIDVPAGKTIDIVVVPGTAGTYKLECTHFLHATFGMTGRIIVE
jgi:uncharacterized cupredoxin-like copper-binding protein